MEVQLTKEEKIKVSNSREVYQILIKILDREEGLGINQEHFWLIGLSEDYMLLFVELIALGTGNRFIVDPREVFYMAVHKNSMYVILAHNHPGEGPPGPSGADEDLTDQLLHAAELLNMEVIDHLVITKDSFYSFTLTGTLSKLEQSKKYAVYFIEEEKLLKKGKEEGVAIGEIKGIKKAEKKARLEKIEIAK